MNTSPPPRPLSVPRLPNREKGIIALLCLAVLICRAIAFRVLFLYDDAFITFRYARNLATGHGLVYNLGEWVLGTTAPLYALVASLFYWVQLPMPASMVWLNILLDAAVFLFSVRTFLRNEELLTKVIFGTLFAVSPLMNRIAVGGMEMSLFLLITLAAIWYFQQGRDYLGIALASIGYFIRPETGLLVVLLLIVSLRRESIRKTVLLAGTAALTVAVPLVVIYANYGQIFSQSVMAKLGMAGRSSIGEVFHAFLFVDPITKWTLVFAIVGCWQVWRSVSELRILSLWMITFILFYLATRPMTVASWYAELPVFCVMVFGSVGIVQALRWVRLERGLRWTLPAASMGAFAAIAIWIAIYSEEGPSRITTDVYGKLESWCQQHTTPQSRIMAVDIGALGYYSNSYIYDQYGLVSPGMLQFHSDSEAVRKLRPDFAYVGYIESEASSHVTNDYTEAASFIPTYPPGSGRLMKHWFAEYHMFQRKE